MSGLSFPQVSVTGLTAIPDREVLGNVSGTSSLPTGITSAQLTGLINAFTTTASGAVPASGTASATSFLSANGLFTAVPSPAFVLIASQSSSVSTASFIFSSGIDGTYKNYEFVYDNVVPATNAVTLLLKVSTSAGSTFISTGYTETQNSTTFISLSVAGAAGNTAGVGASGRLMLADPSNTSTLKQIYGQSLYYTSGGSPIAQNIAVGGIWTTNTSAINGIQIICSTGNLTGAVYMYGLRGS